jgi:hypothetical protein
MPDGIFSNQKSKFGYFLEGLAAEDVCTFYGHLVFFADFWSVLQTFGILFGHLVYAVVI